MISSRGRILRAFALAPLAAPATFAAAFLGISYILALGRDPWPSAGAVADLLVVVAAVGIPVAYAAALLAGAPVYLLLRRLDAVRRATLVCGGGIIGIVTALLLAPRLRGDLFSIPFPWWVGLGLGIVASEVFWRLLRSG